MAAADFPELRFYVRELIETPERQPRDDWSLSVLERAREGHRAHRDYFRERIAELGTAYRTEVWLSHRFDWEDRYHIIVRGRLDGMIESESAVTVEEVKSTPLSGEALQNIELERSHEEQCGLYCLLLDREEPGSVASGRVVYVSLVTGERVVREVAYRRDDFERLLDARIRAAVRRLEEQERLRQSRLRAAESLRFPFERTRASQDVMMRDLASAAADGLDMLCQAPTGVGKTAAALFPLSRAALQNNSRLFFVTSRISQQDLAVSTLRSFWNTDDGGQTGVGMQLRAKERSCPQEIMRCVQGLCPYLTNFQDKLESSGVVDRLLETEGGVADADSITAAALETELCPFELSLAVASKSSVIIADFNYVFDPRVHLRRFFGGTSGGSDFLIVDEAHNLPERARGYYSPVLEIQQYDDLIPRCEEAGRVVLGSTPAEHSVFARCADLLREIRSEFYERLLVFEEEQDESPFYVERPDADFFERVGNDVERLLFEYYGYLAVEGHRGGLEGPGGFRYLEGKRYRDALLETLFALRDFSRNMGRDPEYFAVVWRRQPEARLEMICLDASPFLRERMGGFLAATCMSATLAPFDFFAHGLGLPDALRLELPSPFPKENRLIVTATYVDTVYKHRSESAPEIAETIVAIAALRPGNYLAFFSSFAFRDEVVAHLPAGDYRLILQSPAMPAEMVLQLLRSNDPAKTGAGGLTSAQTILLFAVHGGVFAEGVDFPAHMAAGAFVVGPGLPLFDVERQLIREHYDNQGRDGFDFAFTFPGMQRSVQAAGRVIRSESDRGFVILLGRRFREERYVEKMPRMWRDEMQSAESRKQLLKQVQGFWESG